MTATISRPTANDDDDELGSVTAVPPSLEVVNAGTSESRIDSLLEENERLRQRVSDLEWSMTEYRRQVSQVLSSMSWRLTAPLRLAARWSRSSRVRLRRRLRALKARRSGVQAAPVTGLFPPAIDSLPFTSPLRKPYNGNIPFGHLRVEGPADRPYAQPRVLVIAHVHYPELWLDIADRLVRMPEEFDLLVTVTEGAAESAIPAIIRRHPTAQIKRVPNRGRDWGPLVALADEGLLSGYDAVAKVHTKKSEHRVDGDGWRLELLDGVFESPIQIQRILDALRSDPTLGMVVPNNHLGSASAWGSNLSTTEALASRWPMAFDRNELVFPSGSMFWCRPWLLERLSDLSLSHYDFEVEAGQYDGTTAHALERMVGVMAKVGGMDVVESLDVGGRLRELRRRSTDRPRQLAFYLPQYHRCAENDEFWGEGFTDWDNVRKAEPLFAGHRQPVVPADSVGMYDLSDSSELVRQWETASSHGIDGFIIHHYWFDGRAVLDTPVRKLLGDPTIEMRFALCWANEPWTRRWDGLDDDVLIAQRYSAGWQDRFLADALPALKDPRYLTVDDRPILVIYRPDLVPNLAIAVARMRELATAAGLPGLHVLAVAPSRDFGALPADAAEALDGLVRFPPGSGLGLDSVVSQCETTGEPIGGDVYSYEAAVRGADLSRRSEEGLPVHLGIMPGWDNTARRGTAAYVFHGSNPVTFRRWAQAAALASAGDRSALVFINAWNEWAEGAHLEPDARFGSGYLRALRDATVGMMG